MITTRIARRLITLTVGALLTLVALASSAFAYPPLDGPYGGGGAPQAPTSTATSSGGSSFWVFLLVVAVTAAIAVLATLMVERMRHHGAVTAH